MRLKNVDVAVDQLTRAECHLVGEMDAPAMRLNRLTLKRDLARDIALRILIVLTFDVDAGSDALDRAYRVGGVIDGNPVDIR